MLDQSSIDLVQLIGQSTNLRGDHMGYRGRCPIHNGSSNTSLVVIDRGDGWSWECWNGCGKGDAIAWVRKYHDLDFIHAADFLNLADQIISAKQAEENCTFIEACVMVGFSYREAQHLAVKYDNGNRAAVEPKEQTFRAPSPNDLPWETWRNPATAFVEECEALYTTALADRARQYMTARGFRDDTLRQARIGYNPTDRKIYRPDWGLPIEKYTRDGEEHERKYLYLPRGVVIPWFIGGQLWKIFIRTPQHMAPWREAYPKYWQVSGGGNSLYNADRLRAGKPAIVVEAALDALAIEQEAGDLITAVACGTSGARTMRWIAKIGLAKPLLLGFDNDAGGANPVKYWKSAFPDARVYLPLCDDPAKMLQTGGNVRAWIQKGLGMPTNKPAQVDAFSVAAFREAFLIGTTEARDYAQRYGLTVRQGLGLWAEQGA